VLVAIVVCRVALCHRGSVSSWLCVIVALWLVAAWDALPVEMALVAEIARDASRGWRHDLAGLASRCAGVLLVLCGDLMAK